MSENTLHLSLKKTEQYSRLPKIVVMGVGGGGCNAINNMMDKKIEGVEFVAVNTDVQSLVNSKAQKTIQLVLVHIQKLVVLLPKNQRKK